MPNHHFTLTRTQDFLGLIDTSDATTKPFYIDFTKGKLAYRSRHAGRRSEMIAKAMGCKPADHYFMIDATAGLGRDSFILASLGYHITLIEKSPLIYALLNDAIARATQHPALSSIMKRMTLIQADAVDWLKKESSKPIKPDIIYLDPMFPPRQKSAKVKKEMAFLQDLLPPDDNPQLLLNQALACAARRVVVKRPRLADNLADKLPTYSLTGKSSRFDIYII